ncbi:hypothetical protein C8F01DRAFT_994514, partial [Mycena amicta]
PDRTPGALVAHTGYPAPEPVRRRMASGWTTHIPFTHLTDKYCAPSNIATVKAIDDAFGIDRSSASLVAITRDLDPAGELDLLYDEWDQSATRMQNLIDIYVYKESAQWATHFQFIRNHPNRSKYWGILVAYDAAVRRAALTSDFDPATLQVSIWNECEANYNTDLAVTRAMALARTEMAKIPSGSGAGSSSGGPFRSQTMSRTSNKSQSHPYAPAQSSRHGNHSFRCFVCTSEDSTHRSRNCQATELVNGKSAVLLWRGEGQPRSDARGSFYCYNFNGVRGCQNGKACVRGHHWCTLCGSKSGSHSAQSCSAF